MYIYYNLCFQATCIYVAIQLAKFYGGLGSSGIAKVGPVWACACPTFMPCFLNYPYTLIK